MDARLDRWAKAVAVVELVGISSGALTTSYRIAFGRGLGEGFHTGLGMSAVVFAIALSLVGVRRLASWLVLSSIAVAGLSGWPSLHVVWHAVFAHLALGLAIAAVELYSPGWAKPTERVDMGPWSAVRPAAMITPGAVLIQISLGALYRHQIIGVMPHMLGAIVVALLTLVVSVILLQHFGKHQQLKSAATSLISAVLVQVCLGIAVFMMLLLNAGNSSVFAVTATAHVFMGALTLAASVVTAMQVARVCGGDTQADRSMRSTGPST
jgi:hypothetical protein